MEKNEKFAASIINEESGLLEKEYSYPLKLNCRNMLKNYHYQVYLNGEHVGQISNVNKNITINTLRIKNVLCAVEDGDKAGSKAYCFFKAFGEPAKGYFILEETSLFFINPKKNGVELLRPE
jgi:hypothetical protein